MMEILRFLLRSTGALLFGMAAGALGKLVTIPGAWRLLW